MFAVGLLQTSQSFIYIISINFQSVFCLLYGKSSIYNFLYAMIQ